ncbi:hypothetical protein PIB30_102223, partial [Stylosanthes scabra]|nr:hypothetical protein [Stylosanthes scabra]
LYVEQSHRRPDNAETLMVKTTTSNQMQPSTHMLAVLRICVALEWASEDGVTFSSSNVSFKRELLASHAYAWASTPMRG